METSDTLKGVSSGSIFFNICNPKLEDSRSKLVYKEIDHELAKNEMVSQADTVLLSASIASSAASTTKFETSFKRLYTDNDNTNNMIRTYVSSSGSCSSSCKGLHENGSSQSNVLTVFCNDNVLKKTVGEPSMVCTRSCSSYIRNSASSSSECGGQFVSECHRRSSLLVMNVSDVIAYAIVVSLLTGVCPALCESGVSPYNSSSTEHISSIHSRSKYTVDINSSYANKTESSGSSSSNQHLSEVRASGQEVLPLSPEQQSGQRLNTDSHHSTKDTIKQTAYLSATVQSQTVEKYDKDMSKIISVVIPFVCVILVALILFVTWRLCQRYKCCHNKKCLEKCSTFCNNCMSTPYVFQAPAHMKIQDQVSRDSTHLTLITRTNPSPVSQANRTVVRQPSRTSHMSHGSQASMSAGVSRHGSARSDRGIAGYASVVGPNSGDSHSGRKPSGHRSTLHQKTANVLVPQHNT